MQLPITTGFRSSYDSYPSHSMHMTFPTFIGFLNNLFAVSKLYLLWPSLLYVAIHVEALNYLKFPPTIDGIKVCRITAGRPIISVAVLLPGHPVRC